MLDSLPSPALALVLGSSGGIGQALVHALGTVPGLQVIALSRSSAPAMHLTNEASLAACAVHVARCIRQTGLPLRLVINTTGTLHGTFHGTLLDSENTNAEATTYQPEKSWSSLSGSAMAQVFAINTIGPALLMKHFLPLLAHPGKAVFATLSAKVGSIGDNRLGGWYSYRASKAALNQLVHTAAIELRRRHPDALCIALHPGTVDTGLSGPFAKSGLDVVPPEQAALRLLGVVNTLSAQDSGGFFNHDGSALPW